MSDMTNMQHTNQQEGSSNPHQLIAQVAAANHRHLFNQQERQIIENSTINLNNINTGSSLSANAANNLNRNILNQDSMQKEQQETICDQAPHLYHHPHHQLGNNFTNGSGQQKLGDPQQQHLFSVLINNKTIKGKQIRC